MATTKTPKELATDAVTLASSFEYVYHGGILYAPMDYLSGDMSVIPPDDRKVWVPLDQQAIQRVARAQFDTLFRKEDELRSFINMVQQEAQYMDHASRRLLIKTTSGLKVLEVDGTLQDPDGTFIPNTIGWTLNEDPDDQASLWATITEWVGGDEEIATSLLRYLATALAPHWSAGKYVLFIGDGRNGKSVLMTMLEDLFGRNNCSHVTRQMISEGSVATCDLNGKLLNIVKDGPAEFVKDSGAEKSLITGEAIGIRRLYSQTLTTVQTNALFIEGLNQEPKTRDKSSALQARLIRFVFPNKYDDDLVFMQSMRSEKMLGALLALLIQNYVKHEDVAVMLAPTAAALAAQLEHMVNNSYALQFIQELEINEPLGAVDTLEDMPLDELAARFKSWRLKQGDMTAWDTPGVMQLFAPLIYTDRRSARVSGKKNPVKIKYVTGLKKDALSVLLSMKEEADATTVVDN